MSLSLKHSIVNPSPIATIDPRWKLAGLFGLAIGIGLLNRLDLLAISLAIALKLVWLAQLPWQWYWPRIRILLFSLLPFFLMLPFVSSHGELLWNSGILECRSGGLWLAAALACKATAIVSLALVAFGSACPHANFAALHKLGLPGVFVQILELTYRYLFLLSEEFSRLRIALRVRGFHNRLNARTYRTIAHAFGSMFVRGLDRSEHVAQAMRCRGGDGTPQTLLVFRTRTWDVLFFAMLTTIAAILLVVDRN